jgi:hypothetical protein
VEITMPSILAYPTHIALSVALLVSAGCKESDDSTENSEEVTPSGPTASPENPRPPVECVGLPGKARFDLRSSADQKTLYYLEASKAKGRSAR